MSFFSKTLKNVLLAKTTAHEALYPLIKIKTLLSEANMLQVIFVNLLKSDAIVQVLGSIKKTHVEQKVKKNNSLSIELNLHLHHEKDAAIVTPSNANSMCEFVTKKQVTCNYQHSSLHVSKREKEEG